MIISISEHKRVKLTPVQVETYNIAVSKMGGAKEICAHANVTERTFKYRLSILLDRLKCDTRVELIIKHYTRQFIIIENASKDWRYKNQ